MKRSTKDKAKGKFHELRGKLKARVGAATENRHLHVAPIRQAKLFTGAQQDSASSSNPAACPILDRQHTVCALKFLLAADRLAEFDGILT